MFVVVFTLRSRLVGKIKGGSGIYILFCIGRPVCFFYVYSMSNVAFCVVPCMSCATKLGLQ